MTSKELRGTYIELFVSATDNKKELQKIYTKYIAAMRTLGLANGTFRKELSLLRAGIANRLPQNSDKAFLLFEEQVRRANGDITNCGLIVTPLDVFEADMARKTLAHEIQANTKKSVSSGDIFGLAKEMLLSDNKNEITLGLALATGRRVSEILVSGKFKTIVGTSKHLNFEGQLKAKGLTEQYIVPVAGGIEAKEVRRALLKLDSLGGKYETPEAANAGTAMALKRLTESKLGKGFKFHDTRKIYAAWCLENLLGKDSRIKTASGLTITDSRMFLQAIMGHNDSDMGKYYENIDLLA